MTSKPKKQSKGKISTKAIMPENRHKTGFRGPSPDVGKATQFKPGVSPNPGGRPKDLVSDAQKDLLKKIDEATGKTNAELVAEAQLKVALSGDTSAYCAIRDTTEGRPQQKVTVDGTGNADPYERAKELIAAALARGAKQLSAE
jgi:uncharacterized protein DUF5681